LDCSSCGEKLDKDSKFCKHCGESTKNNGKQMGKEPSKDKKKGTRLMIALIVVGIVVVSLISMFFLFTYEKVNEHEYHSYSPSVPPSSLNVELDMMNGGIQIDFTSDPSEPVVYIDHYKRWEGNIVQEPEFETSSSEVSFDGGEIMGESNSELKVTLRSDVTYSLEITTENGGLSLFSDIPGTSFNTITIDSSNGGSSIFISDATISTKIAFNNDNGGSSLFLKNCTIRDLETKSDSGGSSLFLTNCSIGNIKSTSTSGGVSISTTDLSIDLDSTWTLDANKGDIRLSIVQKTHLGADINIDAETKGWGDIEVTFEGNATYVRSKFTCEAPNGKLTLKNGAGFESPVSGSMGSLNYSDTTIDQFQYIINSHDGDVEVNAKNL
jgi:hypothetical protein